MDMTQETLALDIDDKNELTFRIKVEGIDPAPAKISMICEGVDHAYMFTGVPQGHDDLVTFTIPVMKNKILEGVYASRVEVLIDNKHFVPVKFNVNFKKTISVVAEAVVVPTLKKKEIIVTAAPIVPVVEQKQNVVIQTKQQSQQKQVQQNPLITPKQEFTTQNPLLKQSSNSQKEELDEDSILEAASAFIKSQLKRKK